jgi:restriction system protein
LEESKPCQKGIANGYSGMEEELKGASPAELKVKAESQQARLAALKKRQEERDELDNLRELAEYDTHRAGEFIEECGNILRANLNAGNKLDWAGLYDDGPYLPFVFNEPVPRYELIAREMGVPKKSLFAELFVPSAGSKRVNMEAEAKREFDRRLKQYGEMKEAARLVHEKERAAYIERQAEYNRSVDRLQLDYEKGSPEAVESIARLILARTVYPNVLEVAFDAQYDQTEKLLVINCVLPGPEDIPRTVRHEYNEEERGITAVEMDQKDFNDFYESILLQLTLSGMHNIFRSMPERLVKQVGFNGWINKEEQNSCILTCKVSREVFDSLDLAGVPPRQSFSGLNGVMVEPLTALTPVRPLAKVKETPPLYPETGRTSTGEEPAPGPPAYHPGDFKHIAGNLVLDLLNQIESNLLNTGETKKTDIH